MIPFSLTLEGFLSYKDAVSVDLSGFKVACVSGPNGAGKSSLFDAITWSLFGRARRSDDALIHTKAESARVQFEFDYENNRYRVERIKPRGKGTSLEFHVRTLDGDWKSFTEAGIRATEERIQAVLGLDYETFVNASFFLQGKADLFSMQPAGKRKEILSNILGLNVWETYRDEAARRRREAHKQQEIQQSFIAEAANELDQEAARREKLAHEEELLAARARLRESKEKLLDSARLENAQLQSEQEKLDLLSSQARELDSRITDNADKLQARQVDLAQYDAILLDEKEIIQSYQDYQQIRGALSALDTVGARYNALIVRKTELAGVIQAHKARLEQELQNLLERKEEVAGLTKTRQTWEQTAQELESEAARLQSEIDKIDALETDQGQQKNTQSEKEGENKQLRLKMDEISERIAHLEQASGPDCPLCGQQLTEDHKDVMIARLNNEGKEFGDRYRANQEIIAACKLELQRLSDQIRNFRGLRPQLSEWIGRAGALRQQAHDAQQKIESWEKEGASRLKTVKKALENGQVASEQYAELEKLERDIADLDYSPAQHQALREQEQALRPIEEKIRLLEQARAAGTGLRREIAELEKQQSQAQKDNERLAATIEEIAVSVREKEGKAMDLAQLEAELREVRLEENHARQEVGAAQQLVNVLDNVRARKSALEAEERQIARQIARLKMLETAFGKDGVPALLIENAIPQIETQANEILDKLSGGNMSVSFETERDYADKKREDRRQTLDIIIRDSAGARAYELFSGGEAFRINFAIRLALSRVLAQRSGARLQTLVIDEGFGSQDAQGRQRLVEAINLVRDDFEKILVITHLDELKDAFSSRIEVTKTNDGSQVEVIL